MGKVSLMAEGIQKDEEQKKKIKKSDLQLIYDQLANLKTEEHEITKCTSAFVRKRINKVLRRMGEGTKVLNAGSLGVTFTFRGDLYLLDASLDTMKGFRNAYVGSVERMPFQDGLFDAVICVDSVLDYSDAGRVIKEISRVLKKGGRFILEYERSQSGLVAKEERNRETYMFHNNYYGRITCLYSDEVIKKYLTQSKLKIKSFYYLFVLYPFFHSVLGRDTTSIKWGKRMRFLESMLGKIPGIQKLSHKGLICGIKLGKEKKERGEEEKKDEEELFFIV